MSDYCCERKKAHSLCLLKVARARETRAEFAAADCRGDAHKIERRDVRAKQRTRSNSQKEFAVEDADLCKTVRDANGISRRKGLCVTASA